jgi:hypothetical protein
MKRASGVIALIVLFLQVAGCGSNTKKDIEKQVGKAREGAENAAGTAGALAAAEALRTQLLAKKLSPDQTLRTTAVLQDVADNVPGAFAVSGIDDTDGDGKDDDGKVQVTLGDQSACLTVQDNGESSVANGAC